MAIRLLGGAALVIAVLLAIPTLLAVFLTIATADYPSTFMLFGIRLDVWWPAFALAMGIMLVFGFWAVRRPARD